MLTVARLILLLPTVLALRQPGRGRTALWYMITAMLTDVVDGPLARRRGEVSPLGQILDPVADKLVLNTVAITLARTSRFPWWMTVLFLTRDVGILLSALHVYRRHGFVIPSQRAGKVMTVALTTAMLLYIADNPRCGLWVLYVALATGFVSVWEYGRLFAKLMRS